MSFVFCPFYKILLKNDIKNKILENMKNIKIYSNWNDFDFCISGEDIDLTSLNFDDIFQQCNIWKTIANLSIDLWMDYDYYHQFMFKSLHDSKECDERMENLGFECDNGLWKSVHQPSEDIVIRNVFVFCLYRLMLDEMTRKAKKEDCTENTVEDKNSDTLTVTENVKDNELENVLNEVIYEKEKNNYTLEENKTQWKCKDCSTRVSYEFDVCNGCGNIMKRCGVWYCVHCTMENKCSMSNCCVCDEKNANFNDDDNKCQATAEYVSPSLYKNKRWQCQNINCKQQNYENIIYCYNCKLKRNHSRKRGDEVERQLKYGNVSIWICQTCNKFNDLSVFECCGKTRYGRVKCPFCYIKSDGYSRTCNHCGTYLFAYKYYK